MIEKILERLSARENHHKDMVNNKTGVLSEIDKCSHLHYAECFKEAKEIVQEVAKDGGWIPCSERLPEIDGKFLCTYIFKHHYDMQFVQVLDYYATDETPHFQHTLGVDGMEVIAWQPLPALFKKGE